MRPTRRFAIAACAFVLLGGRAQAAQLGTAEQARALLLRAVAAVKADERAAIANFNRADGGFRQGDLYVFCATTTGTVDAHVDPAQIGRKLQDQFDVDGVAFGREMMALARPGAITAVAYMWPRPDSRTPAEKVSFVTRVADQVCGVGYYK